MNKNLSKGHVKKIAQLAQLNIKESELKLLYTQVFSIMKYMREVGSINTSNIKETAWVSDELNCLREDVVGKSLTQEQALKNAKNIKSGFFVVPYVFSKTK